MKNIAVFLALICACASLAAQDALLRDPTRPPGWREAPADMSGEGGLRLEILWRRGEKRLATISGMQLAVGEEADGLRLLSIGDGEVTVENAQGQQVLRLASEVDDGWRTGEKR